MVTLSDADKVSEGVREMNAKNRALLATMDDCSILSRSLSPPNKSRLQLIDADPQINTLKYIDETLSCCKSLDSTQLAGMGESYDSKNGFLGDSCDTIAKVDFDRLAAARTIQPTVEFKTPPPRTHPPLREQVSNVTINKRLTTTIIKTFIRKAFYK